MSTEPSKPEKNEPVKKGRKANGAGHPAAKPTTAKSNRNARAVASKSPAYTKRTGADPIHQNKTKRTATEAEPTHQVWVDKGKVARDKKTGEVESFPLSAAKMVEIGAESVERLRADRELVFEGTEEGCIKYVEDHEKT